MASRSSARAFSSASQSPAPSRIPLSIAQPASSASPQLLELRRNWKWAAISQYLYTFSKLVALEDVTLVDLEEDLLNGTMVVIPRLMQRLLVTLTQDRKTSVDTWQTVLRRQYLRRDPDSNPIGFEPIVSRQSRAATEEIEWKLENNGTDDDDAKNAKVDEESDRADNDFKDDRADDKYLGSDESEQEGGQVNPEKGSTIAKLDVIGTAALSPLKDWADLSCMEKLESIHTVMEWHFQNPTRFRQTMRSDDEEASWRIEPIGYDAKLNAYWYIGTDRLWIQRSTPKPPRKARKRKAPKVEPSGRKSKVAKMSYRPTTPRTPSSKKPEKSARRSGRDRTNRTSKTSNVRETTPPPSSGRGTRAAKTQANAKLDMQAKELAATRKEMLSFSRRAQHAKGSSPSNSPKQTRELSSRSVGTRISSRLRGKSEEDEWQPIPENWLREDEIDDDDDYQQSTPRRNSTRIKSTAASRSAVHDTDNESDLTDLSDVEDDEPEEEEIVVGIGEENGEQTELDPEEDEAWKEYRDALENFIEWETLCVSLYEWEAIADRWAKATHYLEKSLHKRLKNDIVPYVTENLREIERQRQKEESLMNRKRSSRLAVKETEKESMRMEVIRQAEEEEKNARNSRLEGRRQKEEEERLAKEYAREQRRKEREEREMARSRRLEDLELEKLKEETPSRDSSVQAEPHSEKLERKGRSQPTAPKSHYAKPAKPRNRLPTIKPKARASSDDDWELDCEVCGAQGINMDDGRPLLSCGACGRWQHIPCHNAEDRVKGRLPRNWDIEDFTCRRCLAVGINSVPKFGEQMLRPKANGSHSPHRLANGQSSLSAQHNKREVAAGAPDAYGYQAEHQGFVADPASIPQGQLQQQHPAMAPVAWPAPSFYAQAYIQGVPPHVPYSNQAQPSNRVQGQSGPHFPHQIFNQQPTAYNSHSYPHRSQV